MNVYSIISFIAFMVCFFLGNFIYHKNPKNQLNIMIALLCILVGFLAFTEFEYRQAESIQTAFFWLKISSLWPLVPSFLLHISLIFTKSKLLKNKLIYILIYILPIMITLLSLTTNLMIDHVVREQWGWYFVTPVDATLFNIMALWTIFGGLLSGLICFMYYLRSRDLKRKQAKYVFAGLYIPLFISILSDLILPSMYIRVPEMTMTMSTVGIGLMSYGVWKYRFPALTAAVAADEIVSTMSNFMLLLDTKRNVININQATRNLLGYTDSELIGKPINVIFPDREDNTLFNGNEHELMKKGFIANKEALFKTKKGNLIPVFLSISLIQSEDNQIMGIVCIGSDIIEITRAKEEINASLEEKELLLKEVHHRVKNNLQIISSLLNLQSGYIKDEKDLELFKDSQSRVKSMAFIHEQLYQSSNFTSIQFSEYIQNLVTYLLHYYTLKPSQINLKIDVEDVYLDLNTSIPCGLIINELVTNSLKHAFPANFVQGENKEISIKMSSSNKNKYILSVTDNGIGLPDGFDFKNIKSLGLQLVKNLVNQLDGTIEINARDGTQFNIIFNKLEYKERI
ncbi:histidine kinase dimerization/phosphoacceptor domain -containing protein [Methanobacterium sp. ACI-7]|uniref:histidine kinase dimerization/phosphoacceptor domain -containing protein n=1 Tax=unclassified Methanobacterium TaxID=2627676 RepID=UPI0039C1719D